MISALINTVERPVKQSNVGQKHVSGDQSNGGQLFSAKHPSHIDPFRYDRLELTYKHSFLLE